LPLSAEAGRIALIGPCSDDVTAMMGAYSFPVHVLPRHPEFGLGLEAESLPEALRSAFRDAEIVVERGCPLQDPGETGELERAMQAAAAADVAVVVVGDHAGMFGKGTSGEG